MLVAGGTGGDDLHGPRARQGRRCRPGRTMLCWWGRWCQWLRRLSWCWRRLRCWRWCGHVRMYVVVVILRVLVVLVSLAALIVFVVLVRSANSNAAICGVRHGYRAPILAARKAGYVRT